MHHYLTKLIRLRSNAGSSKEEVEQLQKEKMQLKDKEEKASKELKRLQEEISTLSVNLKKLKSECEQKDKQLETADAHVIALQKQSADLLLEYDRLLEDNQNLQKQAQGYKSWGNIERLQHSGFANYYFFLFNGMSIKHLQNFTEMATDLCFMEEW